MTSLCIYGLILYNLYNVLIFIMKRVIAALSIFAAFAALNGCSGTQQNTATVNNGALANANASPAAPADTTVYPPLVAGIADADMELIGGNKFKVSEKKGKVVLLNLWGTWCGPCRAEMPTLIALQDQYRDKGLEIIGVNIGDGNGVPETDAQITKFVEQMKLNYTIARIDNATTREFNKVSKADAVPQSLLVDRQGRLRGVFVGSGPRIYAQLDETMKKVMAE